MSYSQLAVFRPVPAAPLKSSLKTVVQPAGADGTAAAAGVAPLTRVNSPATMEKAAAAASEARLRRRRAAQGRLAPPGDVVGFTGRRNPFGMEVGRPARSFRHRNGSALWTERALGHAPPAIG